MIQHIALVQWQFGVTEAQVLDACRHAEHFPDEIPGVERIWLGRNRSDAKHGFTHAIIVQLSDPAALDAYLEHPIRKDFLARHLAPLEAQRIEVDVPMDLSFDRTDPSSTGWYWGVGIGALLDEV
jgi:hypothetical protein